MSRATWNPDEPLLPPRTWLFEASAGTGKTYQISGLVVRLVAELGIPIREILAITFTKAATGELRDRIRSRLRDAHARLSAEEAHDDDETVKHLRSLGDAERMSLRLELALRDFDLAPISTIHSFCQRMLDDLAFESRQDAQLTLVEDVTPIREELVDDALARLYGATTAEEVFLYQEAGFQREALLAVAKAMCDASEARVVPDAPPDPLAWLDSVREFIRQRKAMIARWMSDEGVAACEALCADHIYINRQRQSDESIREWLVRVLEWLEAGADAKPLVPRGSASPTITAVKNTRREWFFDNWRGSKDAEPPPLKQRPWWPFFSELESFYLLATEFYATFSPLASFAHGVRAKYTKALSTRRLLSFDGMLSRLANALKPGADGYEELATRIRGKFRAAFVDEFQDTDAAQWSVLSSVFHGHTHLFLIGDPKQAIYAFRGADVHVYLAARKRILSETAEGDAVRTMTRNFRSDVAAVEAMNAFWREGSGAFDVDGIDYVTVSATKGENLLPPQAGLEIRWLDGRAKRGPAGVTGVEGEPISNANPRLVASLSAEHVLAWLNGSEGTVRHRDGSFAPPKPSDIAVLVRSHAQAREIRRALERLSIPSVIASTNSVFDTQAAQWIMAWLDAVAARGRDRATRAAAITPLVGWRPDELAWSLEVADRGDDARRDAKAQGVILPAAEALLSESRDWNALSMRFREASERWSKQGFARTFDRDLTDHGALPRLLLSPFGERHVTDLRHLFELLHLEERTKRLGPGPLADWLRSRASTATEDVQQRLESDANAVRVETIHVSKGLEYPLVLLPFAWQTPEEKSKRHEPLVLREQDGTLVDLSSPLSDTREEAEETDRKEVRREATRQLYVALTRARHKTIAWFGPVGRAAQRTDATALGRLLCRSEEPDPKTPGEENKPPIDFGSSAANAYRRVMEHVNELLARAKGTISWMPAKPPLRPARWAPPGIKPEAPRWPEIRPALALESRFTVTSYTGIARAAAELDRDEKLKRTDAEGLASEFERLDDALAETLPSFPKPSFEPYECPPRLSAGGGTLFGTFVHEALESIEFRSGLPTERHRSPEKGAPLKSLGIVHGFSEDSDEVCDLERHLPSLLTTPLDTEGAAHSGVHLPKGWSLSCLDLRDRRDELAFDLRLGDGTQFHAQRTEFHRSSELDAFEGCLDPRRIYEALTREPETATVAAWLDEQRARKDDGRALLRSMAGILTGSIDLVFRIREDGNASGLGRYFVVDYKTNRIDTSEAGHYASAWLDWKMSSSGYMLQSLLYTVALHRHLTVRAKETYRYEDHFGGCLYLFLRGMAGPSTPRDRTTGRCLGVHAHTWSPEVIRALDEALSPAEEHDR
jgi:exodeoxyribonuclease V beta subunit